MRSSIVRIHRRGRQLRRRHRPRCRAAPAELQPRDNALIPAFQMIADYTLISTSTPAGRSSFIRVDSLVGRVEYVDQPLVRARLELPLDFLST